MATINVEIVPFEEAKEEHLHKKPVCPVVDLASSWTKVRRLSLIQISFSLVFD